MSPTHRAKCGTYSGWQRHYKRHEIPCGPCEAAVRAYRASRKDVRREQAAERRERHEALLHRIGHGPTKRPATQPELGEHAACKNVRCHECVLIEQGIARGDSDEQIAAAAQAPLERVATVRQLMAWTVAR